MVRTRVSLATSEQTITLAKKCIARNGVARKFIDEVKSKQFVVNHIAYSTEQVMMLVKLWEDISSGIKSGKIKATKAKGLTIPK